MDLGAGGPGAYYTALLNIPYLCNLNTCLHPVARHILAIIQLHKQIWDFSEIRLSYSLHTSVSCSTEAFKNTCKIHAEQSILRYLLFILSCKQVLTKNVKVLWSRFMGVIFSLGNIIAGYR